MTYALDRAATGIGSFYGMLNSTSMKEIFLTKKSAAISRQVSPASLLYVSAGNCQRALVDESGMVIDRMGRTIVQK
jgi:hypothetical protein